MYPNSFKRLREIFVGREVELGRLHAAAEDLLSGAGRVVMVSGETGIGKTRLVQEFLRHPPLADAAVVWGRCYEQEVTPPYWPWAQALREYGMTRYGSTLLSELGRARAFLVSIVPGLEEAADRTHEARDYEQPDLARFLAFDATTDFLNRASHAEPLVIVLEDLQWSDEASLKLLEFVARGIRDSRVLIIGTFRPSPMDRGHVLLPTLVELAREPHFERLTLGGLSLQDIRSHLSIASEEPPAAGIAEAIHARTDGNPLFLVETIKYLQDHGGHLGGSRPSPAIAGLRAAHEPGADFPLPQSIRDLVNLRLEQLPDRVIELLEMAAVLGRQFSFEHLARLVPDVDEVEVSKLLDDALDRDIIEETPVLHTSFRFAHSVVQQGLLESISGTKRARLHAQVVHMLEEQYGDDAPDHAAELAHHSAAARPLIGDEKIIEYSAEAGRRALEANDYEHALVQYSRALGLRGTAIQDSLTADLLFGVGVAQAATSEHHNKQAAVESLTGAFNCYVACGEVQKAVDVARFPVTVAGFPELTELPSKGLELVPGESIAAGQLMSRLGLAVGLSHGDRIRAEELLTEASRIARVFNDPSLELQANANLGSVVGFWFLDDQRGLESSLRAIELASTNRTNVYSELRARADAVACLTRLGRLSEAREHATEMLALAERANNKTYISIGCVLNVWVAVHEGRLGDASAFNDRGLRVSPDSIELLAGAAFLSTLLGDDAVAERHGRKLSELIEADNTSTPLQPASAAAVLPAISAVTGSKMWIEIAKQAASRTAGLRDTTRFVEATVASGLAQIAVLGGDTESIGMHYRQLSNRANTALPKGWMCADHLLALLASGLRDAELTTRHFQSALNFCRAGGFRCDLAWVCHDYAEYLLAKPSSADRAHIRTLIAEGDEIACELKLSPLEKRFDVLKERLVARRGGRPENPSGLTEREVEVLRLIAAGKSNREIADELFISPHTVIRHVSNIYAKTGSTNRAEAATYANQHELVS